MSETDAPSQTAWVVTAEVTPNAVGVCLVEVTARHENGLHLRVGGLFEWPQHYEARDMEAAGLAQAARLFDRLSATCRENARRAIGANPVRHPPATGAIGG